MGLTPGDYRLQGIDFYSKNACGAGETGGTGSATLVGNGNAEKIWNFLVGNDGNLNEASRLTPEQAAGVMGNIQAESRFDPGIEEATTRPSKGYGIIQWTFERRIALENAAKQAGVPSSDLGFQLNYLYTELNQRPTNRSEYRQFENEWKMLQGQNSIEDALVAFHHEVEISHLMDRPDPRQAVIDARLKNALDAYESFKGSSPSGNPAGGAATGCGGATGAASDFSADGFIVYNQCDTRWATVPYGTSGKTACSSGCGPTAMAMAITALTKKSVTPAETVAYASSRGMYVNGKGSSWVLPKVIGDKFGVQTKTITMTASSINDVLKAGGLVILSGENSAPFTSAGHYILIRGVTESGKWKIGDSNGETGKKNSTTEWNPQDILVNANAGSTYAVTN
jgi:hypothetical protein